MSPDDKELGELTRELAEKEAKLEDLRSQYQLQEARAEQRPSASEASNSQRSWDGMGIHPTRLQRLEQYSKVANFQQSSVGMEIHPERLQRLNWQQRHYLQQPQPQQPKQPKKSKQSFLERHPELDEGIERALEEIFAELP